MNYRPKDTKCRMARSDSVVSNQIFALTEKRFVHIRIRSDLTKRLKSDVRVEFLSSEKSMKIYIERRN